MPGQLHHERGASGSGWIRPLAAMLLIGGAASAGALASVRPSLASSGLAPSAEPTTLELTRRPNPEHVDKVDPDLLASLDETSPEAVGQRLRSHGWVIVGEPRIVETAWWTSYDVTAALAIPPLGSVDGTLMLYRFRHPAFVDRVLPFLKQENGVVWVRDERTLLFAHIRKNERASERLLRIGAGLGDPGP